MVIYKTTNLINGKYYIGKDAKNDKNYLGSGIAIKKAIIKYGKENFKKEILLHCNNLKELNEKETEIINESAVNDPNSYNLVLGGQGGNFSKFVKHNPFKGVGYKQYFINKLGEEKGLKKYEEYLKKKSESVSGEKNGMYGSSKLKGEKNGMYGKKGEKCPFYGIKRTEEQRENYRKAQLGKKLSNKTKSKMSLSHKNRDRGYYIEQIDNKGKVLNKFKTIKEAVDTLKISRKKAYQNSFKDFKFVKIYGEFI